MSKINFGFEKIHQDEKENRVAGVFDSVAKNYDLMNDLMSFGMHRLWKEVLVEIAELNKDSYVLDVASGTCDIPKIVLREFPNNKVYATDINHNMLEVGYKRSIDENFFKRVDWAVQNALDNDLAIVINIHHFEEIFSDPLAFKQKLLSLWEQIARHFKDYPDDIIFEMLNEPHQKLTSEIWNEFIAEGISLIRKIDDERTLMIGPANWNSINSLNTLEIPNDENLIITVHYYSPFEFTHQGASWVEDSDRWMGTTWDATNTQKELIDKDIAIAKEWGIRNNRPIFIGEFGAYSKADFNSRFRWTEYMVQVMQKNEISWSYWEFCSGFGAWDQQTKKWNELLYALIQPN